MLDTLITVIVPIYNILDCLERCVESICHQTYKNLEIILVDDGSTDGTEDLVDRLAAKDPRIIALHKENGGSSSARNLGLQHATGEYIGFVDSDDYIDPHMYETLLAAIYDVSTEQVRGKTPVFTAGERPVQKPKYLMAQISRDEIDEQGNKLPDVCTPPKEPITVTSEQMMQELLMHCGDASFCTRITHRSLFENRQFPEGKLNEDFYLLIHMLPDVGPFQILPEQYYHVYYRIGSNSRKKDKNDFSRVFTDIVVNADIAEQIVRESYPALTEIAQRFGFYQRLDYILHIPIAQMTKDNQFYRDICGYLKKNFIKMCTNRYLTKKNKIYLLLFTIVPKTTRVVHAKIKRL